MKFFIILLLCQEINFFEVKGDQRTSNSLLQYLTTNGTNEILRYAKVAEIINLIKPTVDPCQNFYAYACGNWARVNPAITEAKTGIFQTLSNAYDRKVIKLLESPKLSNENNMELKVKYFYESCLNRDEIRHDYYEKLLSIMEEFGGMPALKGNKWNAKDFDWLKVIAEILRKYGQRIIIGVDISADLNDNQKNRIYLGQPEQVISSNISQFYERLQFDYEQELQFVLKMSQNLASATASSIVNFEKSLAQGISDPFDGFGYQDRVKLRSLEDMSKSYEPTINFTRFISTWLGYDYDFLVYEFVESYQINLKKVIEKTPKSVIANYIMWELIQDFRLEAEKSVEAQKSKCVEATKNFFVKYLDNMFYRELLEQNKNLKTDILQIFKELKENFSEILLSHTSSWLTAKTLDKALEKLTAMSLEINTYENEDFEEQFGGVIVNTACYFDNVISILEQRGRYLRHRLLKAPKLDIDDTMNYTPAYAAEFNAILMPVSFLQPRFLWDPIYPAAIKYATVGYIIAHEMAHAFDDSCRLYDTKGNVNNWWDEKSTIEFHKRKECLSQHYSEYRFAGRKLQRSNAQDENIADNVGIRVAYGAFKKWLLKQNQDILELEKLPFLNFTAEKLFFVSLAQIWCSDVHELVRPYLAKVDIHAPEEVRVLAMMSNFDEFSNEFQCKPGSRMNPQRKCVIY